MQRTRWLLALVAVLVVLAAGAVHLREWLDIYRNVPAEVPGSAVVRVGFVAHALTSLVLASAIGVLAFAWVRRGWLAAIVAAAAAFEAASAVALVASRNGGVLGWSEAGWTDGAVQSLALAIAGVAVLVALLATTVIGGRREAAPAG